MQWGQEHPHTFSCVGIGNCNIYRFSNTRCTCYLIYIGIVLVGRRLNLWREHTIVCYYGKRVPTKNRYVLQILKHTSCYLIYIGIVLVGRQLNLWREHTIVCYYGKRILTKNRYVFQSPKHTSARWPSWSYDLIYDIVGVWPDQYQEHNVLIQHRHHHDNLRDVWQSLLCAFIWNASCKAHCY